LTTAGQEAILLVLDGLEPSTTAMFRQEVSEAVYLGQAICLEGEDLINKEHEAKITVSFADDRKKTIALAMDRLYWWQATPGTEATLEYSFTKAQLNNKHKGKLSIVFGEVGIVIDTRGRSFDLPSNTPEGKKRLQQWLASLQHQEAW